MLRILLFATLFFAFGNLSAQHLENLNSDNPGLTQSPFTVGSRTIQIEAGYNFRSTDYKYFYSGPAVDITNRKISNRSNEATLKARYGIIERLDISFQYAPSHKSITSSTDNSAPQSREDQTDFFRVGIKGLILKQNGISPAVGAEVFWQHGAYDLESAGIIVSAQNNLTEKFSLRGNLSFTGESSFHGGLHLLYEATDKLGAFAEYSGFFNNPDFYILENYPANFQASNITTGLIFRATPNWMFDLSGSWFLTPDEYYTNADFENYNSYLLSIGVSGRFDWRKD